MGSTSHEAVHTARHDERERGLGPMVAVVVGMRSATANLAANGAPALPHEAEFAIDLDDMDDGAQELEPGAMVPNTRLRVLERLGDGGGGVVFRGEHVDLLRPVAIKVMRGVAMARTNARASFLAEARTTSRIESPWVVKVVDFGELPSGGVWYAMELLGGAPLDRLIDTDEPLPLARVIGLLRMACKGLAAVHASGVVHRDVKPQNMIVVQRDGRDHLSLVDLGIAHPSGSKPALVTGTPEYMAREQILREVLDPRTDVYALGCCAYELLTRRSLLGACTVQRALLAHTEGVVPEFRDDDGVPPALVELVKRCLAVEPEQRFADTIELEAALCEAQIAARIAGVRDDLPLPAVDDLRRRRIADGFAALERGRTPSRSRWAWLGSGALAVAVALAVGLPADQAAGSYPVEVVPARDVPARVVADVVAPSPTAQADGARWPVSSDGMRDRELPEEPSYVAREAVMLSPLGPAAAPPTPAAVKSGDARHQASVGRRALRRGNTDEAERSFHRALAIDARASAAMAGLADVYAERGMRLKALRYARMAADADPGSPTHLVRVGDALASLGRRGAARREYERAMAMGSTTARGRVAKLDRGERP